MQPSPVPTPADARWTRRDWGAVTLLAVAAVGVYANSLPNAFVYDDHAVVVQDQRSHSLSRIGELFSGPYWTVTTRPLYRPITLLSFSLNHAIAGVSAPGYRAVNLLLHALTCVAVYRLMMLLFGRFWPAVLAGAVFAVHPIHVEAVVPIVGRSELLSGLAVVTALALYAGDAARGGHGVTWRYLAVVLLTWTAILCKESGIVLIGMVVLFDVWRRMGVPPDQREHKWDGHLANRFLVRYAGMLVAVVIAMSMRRRAIGMLFAEGVTFPFVDNPLVADPWWVRILTGVVLLGKYLRLLATGHPLSADYSYNAIPVARSMSWSVAWGLVCVIALALAVAISLRRRREIALGVGWFLAGYAPAANVLVLIGTLFAERLMYLPSMAAALVCGLAVPGAAARWWSGGSRGSRGLAVGLVTATVAGLVTYGVLTVMRNRVWRDDETLFRDGLSKQPESARCQYNIGAWLVSHGQFDDGLKHLQRAVEIADQYFLARTKLATCYLSLSRWRDAAGVLGPLVADTESRSEHLISPLAMLGKARLELGEFAAAWECFERIRSIDPHHVGAMRCQAEIMTRPDAGSLRDPVEGWDLIQRAVNLDPENIASLAGATRIALT